MSRSADLPELSDAEREALHRLRLGVEHAHRGYGYLLACHHSVGHAVDHFERARELLEESGHEAHAAVLRDDVIPQGFVDDMWTYEVVDDVRRGFLADVSEAEQAVRDDLADGQVHVSEQRLQQRWRDRAEPEAERSEASERASGNDRRE
ncbi:hypothetical protein [Halomicrobium salinisoli]|uniref:hypothetical protein n=1 Tax=Halomicrobium salinisoli TaxID=2878391 RepID=UPI001CF08CE1|nr:hypothetical protein [Halomicrobium salinisoli]